MNKKLTICGNDIRKYVIISGAEAAPSEARVAKELAKYILETTGYEPTVMSDACPVGDYEIIVGKTNREGELYTVCREELGDEGYVIMTAGTKLIIAGGEKRGTMYGVYDFLEKYLGWRFFTLTLEKCYGDDEIDIPEGLMDKKVPLFEYRELDWVCARDKHWAVKAKINGNYRKFGEDFGGELNWGGAIHSLYHYLDSTMMGSQPCLSDPKNIESVIQQVGKILEQQPDLDIFEISQNDNQNYCKCERCQQIDEEEGSHSGTLIRLINALADAFKDKYPKLHFQTFAYQYTRKPPQKTKPRDNVIIKLCPIECCYSHAFNDESCKANVEFKADLEAWNEVVKKVYVWDYSTNYAWFTAPFPNFRIMRDNIRFFADNSVTGYYPEANYIYPSGEFAELRSYLHAKLMWDPYLSDEEYDRHMREFLEAYYGAGWENILKFINFTCDEVSNSHSDLWSHPSLVIPYEKWIAHNEEITGWWDAAEEAVKDDKETLENVKRSRLQYTLIKLSIEHDARFEKGDAESRKQYYYDNLKFYNDLVKDNIGWREAFTWPPKIDFQRPPLEWANPHTYGLPEEEVF